nr:hypothetical protein PJ912_23900 [Pectobacterium colocasium]
MPGSVEIIDYQEIPFRHICRECGTGENQGSRKSGLALRLTVSGYLFATMKIARHERAISSETIKIST